MLSKLESFRQQLEQMTSEEIQELIRPYISTSTLNELLFLTCYEGGEYFRMGVFESINKAKEYIQSQGRNITKEGERHFYGTWGYDIYVSPKKGEYDTPWFSLSKTTLNLGV